MEYLLGGESGALPPADLIKDTTTTTFMADVVEASQETPVIVDFWAPWCGPCKQLGPILEKVVTEARGAVRMVKLNIDENPEVAQQMRIQSIPAVFAFSGGRPVDGFAGAQPESQVRQFIDKLIKAAGSATESPVDAALAQADELFEAGDNANAAHIYRQVIEHDPANVAARTGLARCQVETGDLDAAEQTLTAVPEDKRDEAAAAFAALELARQTAESGDTAELEAKVAANPDDLQARFDLGMALYAGGQHDDAIDALVEIVRRDRQWNDDAARKQILQFFEALGPTSPATVAGRRKLSSVLFS